MDRDARRIRSTRKSARKSAAISCSAPTARAPWFERATSCSRLILALQRRARPGACASHAGGGATRQEARDVERDTPLAEQQAIAQSQLDAEIHAYHAAQANVQSLKAAAEAAA